MGGRIVLKDRGSATVEFFLVLPALFLVLATGILVVSVARARIELTGAVREGARVAATSPDPAKAVEAVRLALPEEARASTRIRVSRPSVVGRMAVVTAVSRREFSLGWLPKLTFDLRARAAMMVER